MPNKKIIMKENENRDYAEWKQTIIFKLLPVVTRFSGRPINLLVVSFLEFIVRSTLHL